MPHPGEETRRVLRSKSLPRGVLPPLHLPGVLTMDGSPDPELLRERGFLLSWGSCQHRHPCDVSEWLRLRSWWQCAQGRNKARSERNTTLIWPRSMGFLSFTTFTNFSVFSEIVHLGPCWEHPWESLLAPRCPLFLGQNRPSHSGGSCMLGLGEVYLG